MCRKKMCSYKQYVMVIKANSIRSWETEVWWELLYYHKTITTTLEPKCGLYKTLFSFPVTSFIPQELLRFPEGPRLGGHIFCFSRCVSSAQAEGSRVAGTNPEAWLTQLGARWGQNPILIVPMCKSLSHDGIKWPVASGLCLPKWSLLNFFHMIPTIPWYIPLS